jgi:GntR family transcriptional regulator
MNGEPRAAPIGWTDVYVGAAYADLRDVVRQFPDVLIGALIESRYGRRIAEIRQDVHAVLIPMKLAAELEVEGGTPALKVVRLYIDPAGEASEISVTIHPANRFTFSVRLRRDRE